MERTYSPLLPHQSISYTLYFISVDHQDINAAFFIQLDNMSPLIWTWKDIVSGSVITTNNCGGPGIDYFNFIVGYTNHSSSSLTVRLSSNVSQTSTNTIAVTNLEILLHSREMYIPTGVCVNEYGQFKLNSSSCPSGNSDFQHDPAHINDCAPAAALCYGTSLSQAYTCTPPGSYNSTTCGTCADSNCFICKGDDDTACLFCATSFYLNWNYACMTACDAPYIASNDGSFQICETPCQYNNTFFFANTSCTSICAFPLSIRIEGQAQFCEYPCPPLSSQYLFWNGSCQQTCPFYSRTDVYGYNYCDACQSNYYLFSLNVTCLASCPIPFLQSFLGGSNFCASPCVNASQPYFLMDLQSCNTSCEAPYIIQDSILCISPCLDSALAYYDIDIHICRATCIYPYTTLPNSMLCMLTMSQQAFDQATEAAAAINVATNISSVLASVITVMNPGNPSALLLQSITKMMLYVRYVEVAYPAKLSKMMRTQKTSSTALPFIPAMSQSMASRFVSHPIPYTFAQYGFQSAFLVNFWRSLLTLLILLIVIIVTVICEICTSPSKARHTVVTAIGKMVRWNFSVMFFTTFYDEIILYTSLTLRTLKTFTALSVVDLVVCLIINIIAITTIIKCFHVIYKLRQAKSTAASDQSTDTVATPEAAYFRYEVVFSSYQDASALSHTCLPIMLSRMYLFYIIVAYMLAYPLAQSILLTFMSISILLYLALLRPPRQKLMLVQNIVQELFLLTVNISVLVIAGADHNHSEMIDMREKAGDVIIICNTLFTVANSVFMFASLVVSIWSAVKEKQIAKRSKVARLEVSSQEESKIIELSRNPLFNLLRRNSNLQVSSKDSSVLFPSNKGPEDDSITGKRYTIQKLDPKTRRMRDANNSQMEFLQRDVDVNSRLY